MKNIILIAAPAAGKGTLSELLVKKYGYIHISTGDLLRDISKEESELGKKISLILQNGELVSDEIVFDILEKRLSMDDIKNGFILDGFPRNLEQAKKYDEIVKKLNIDLGIVIVLEADYKILKDRVVGRMLCKECGRVYNTITGVNPPKENNKCTKCGKELYKRSDDNEKSFKIRYENYIEKTKPLINFYQEKKNLFFVKSEIINETLKDVEEILND